MINMAYLTTHRPHAAREAATHGLRCDTILGVDALSSREPSPRLLVAAWGVLFLYGSIAQKTARVEG
jgi:hypothetical protein